MYIAYLVNDAIFFSLTLTYQYFKVLTNKYSIKFI